MDSINYEKILYRIIRGRLRLRLGDLVLFIHEPNLDVIEESFEVYQHAYDKAYFQGVFIEREAQEILLENDLWSPLDDREAKKIEEEIEDDKVDAFKNCFEKNNLRNIKRRIRRKEADVSALRFKKLALEHTTCEGIAKFAQSVWIISQTTKLFDGSNYDWSNYSISSIMEKYNKHKISTPVYRKICRSEPWRSMWAAGKKQSNLFGRPTCEWTKDQLSLVSFSSMYDNVYESHESPEEEVIEDDDCLDGWFIVQRRQIKKMKKERELEESIKNPKIKDSQELFVMAKNTKEAKDIVNLNSEHGKSVIAARDRQIKEAGDISASKLHDIQQQIQMQSHQSFLSKVKGGK